MPQMAASVIATVRTVLLNHSSFENQKYIVIGKIATDAMILYLITRLTVMIELYRRCSTSARYRSKLISVMHAKDMEARTVPTAKIKTLDMQDKR